MRCPKCGCQDDKVIDSRASREGATIRRRRECLKCGYRFTTYEEIERGGLFVIKRDGRREEFSKEKLLAGVKKACQKRPISPKVTEDLVERIVYEVTDNFSRDLPFVFVGHFIHNPLHESFCDFRADRPFLACLLDAGEQLLLRKFFASPISLDNEQSAPFNLFISRETIPAFQTFAPTPNRRPFP